MHHTEEVAPLCRVQTACRPMTGPSEGWYVSWEGWIGSEIALVGSQCLYSAFLAPHEVEGLTAAIADAVKATLTAATTF